VHEDRQELPKEVVMKRVIEALLLLLMVPELGWGQSSQNNWDNLKRLAPGDEIHIVLNDAKSYRGKFHSVSDEAIVVRLVTGEQTFTRENVLRDSTEGQSHRLRNAALGAGIGVGLGFAVAARTSRNDSEAQAIGYAVIPPILGAAGAGVGAFLPTGRWHDIYRAR
jgi:hypothetical protein